MYNSTTITTQTILPLQRNYLQRTLIFSHSIGSLDLHFYYCGNSEEFFVILRKNGFIYEPQKFALQSKYWEGLIQDLLAEINSEDFLEFVGFKTHQILLRLLKDILRPE